MSEDNSIPWTEEQWSTVQQVIHDEAHKTRVAASFLPLFGPLPPDTETVPVQRVIPTKLSPQVGKARGEAEERLEVDDRNTIVVTSIAVNIYVRRTQAAQEDLSSALIMFRRAANIIARVEDALIFSGQPGESLGPINLKIPAIYTVGGGGKYRGLLDNNPKDLKDVPGGGDLKLVGHNLVPAVASAITALEDQGHLSPFALVLGNSLFEAANTPDASSLVLPGDRIKPFLDGPLLRSSTIPENQGILVSLAGNPIEIVVVTDISARFLQLTLEPRYVFRVAERFALRIKQPEALKTFEIR